MRSFVDELQEVHKQSGLPFGVFTVRMTAITLFLTDTIAGHVDEENPLAWINAAADHFNEWVVDGEGVKPSLIVLLAATMVCTVITEKEKDELV